MKQRQANESKSKKSSNPTTTTALTGSTVDESDSFIMGVQRLFVANYPKARSFVISSPLIVTLSDYNTLILGTLLIITVMIRRKSSSLRDIATVFVGSVDSTWDAKKYPLCPPYDGTKGLAWEKFMRDIAVYSMATKDLRFVHYVFCNVLRNKACINNPPPIFTDSQATIDGIRNPGVTSRNRHYERWLQLGRHHYLHKLSYPIYVISSRQLADGLTKPQDKTSFLIFFHTLLNMSDTNGICKLNLKRFITEDSNGYLIKSH